MFKRLQNLSPVIVSTFIIASAYAVFGVWKLTLGPGFAGSDSYSDSAMHFLETGGFETAFRPPLYPLFLAAMMKIFGENWEAGAALFQGFAGVLLGALLVSMVYRLSNSKAVAYLGLILFLGNILFQFEVFAKRESVIFTLLLLLFFAAPIYIKNQWARVSTMGLSMALSFLLRPNAITLIPILFFAWIWQRKSEKNSILSLILGYAVFLSVIFPWQKFVYEVTDTFPVTTSTNSGQTLWKGNHPYLFDVWPMADIDRIEGVLSEEIGGADIKLMSSDAKMKSIAFEYMIENPVETLKTAVGKAVLFFAPFPIPYGSGDVVRTADGGVTLANYRYRNAAILLVATIQSLLVWIGVVLFLLREMKDNQKIFLGVSSALLIVFLLGVHTLTYPESRYRWPLDIFLTVVGSVGLGSLALRRKTTKAESPHLSTASSKAA